MPYAVERYPGENENFQNCFCAASASVVESHLQVCPIECSKVLRLCFFLEEEHHTREFFSLLKKSLQGAFVLSNIDGLMLLVDHLHHTKISRDRIDWHCPNIPTPHPPL